MTIIKINTRVHPRAFKYIFNLLWAIETAVKNRFEGKVSTQYLLDNINT